MLLIPRSITTEHPYFVALQAHPEFCSRPLNPSPPFLGLIAAACGLTTLEEQLKLNEENYVAPHPESAKFVPASEGVTEKAKARKQGAVVKVVGEVDGEENDVQKELIEKVQKVHLREELPNGHDSSVRA